MNAENGLPEIASMLRPRPRDAHKGTMGHALLYAGSRGMAGCAMLAAEACLRSGAGKVSVMTDEANRIPLHTAVPEAILWTAAHEATGRSGRLSTSSGRLACYQSMGIGPGIGRSDEVAEVMQEMLLESDMPLVVDADALHLLATHPQMAEPMTGRSVLTPHVGEMRHLAQGFGLPTGDLGDSACQLATTYGLTVVLKGHPTQIFFPDGRSASCPFGNPGMATAGSGDVLTGLVAGLLAQGYPTAEAAMLGVWLHAIAGDYAASESEEECMLARDILRHLPQAFRHLKNAAKM
ncbi:MAG: NAD(P)H-hydrate dehydratase [Bacteroidaceae bacterium]|nr:NAD(P)H-hydrate dehydratase [Bacteroidaceae bacterium]